MISRQLKHVRKIRQKARGILGDKCARCDETENLDFDHIVPENKYGPKLHKHRVYRDVINGCTNIQLLCKPHHVIKTREDLTTT